MIGKINFIRRMVGSSLENEISTGDFKMLDELYGSGDFNRNQTMVEADHNLASSVEGLARLFVKEETFVNDLKEEVEKVKRALAKFTIGKGNWQIMNKNFAFEQLKPKKLVWIIRKRE